MNAIIDDEDDDIVIWPHALQDNYERHRCVNEQPLWLETQIHAMIFSSLYKKQIAFKCVNIDEIVDACDVDFISNGLRSVW